MKKAIKRLVEYFFVLSSHLPAWFHYAVSDALFPLVYHVVRYRRSVVRRNLTASFPEKTAKEIKRIERGFYHFFCDYIVETCMLLSFSPEEMRKRMKITGGEAISEAARNNDTVILFLGHYGNWEWISSMPLWVAPDVHCSQLYRPLNNEAFESVFMRLRSRFGGENIPKNEALRRILTFRREGTKAIIGFIADQSPRPQNIHDRIAFLHQDTPVFTGGERIAKKLNAPVYFADVKRVSRGHYECELQLMTTNPAEHPDWEITNEYMRRLEAAIRRQPEIWLWSHKRWKHSYGPAEEMPAENSTE